MGQSTVFQGTSTASQLGAWILVPAISHTTAHCLVHSEACEMIKPREAGHQQKSRNAIVKFLTRAGSLLFAPLDFVSEYHIKNQHPLRKPLAVKNYVNDHVFPCRVSKGHGLLLRADRAQLD